jgi:hypothetical protein
MVFEISEYARSMWSDITTIILFSFGIIINIIFGIKGIRNKQKFGAEILKLVVIVILLSTPIINCYPSLANGGVTFLMEKDSEPVVCTGEIESICESSKRIPTYKYDHKFGADIVIDGVTYFAATAGEFQVGDTVEVYYFENSKFIFKLNKLGV